MRKISSLDLRIIDITDSHIFKTLLDFEKYSEWYPKNVKIEFTSVTPQVIGSKIGLNFMGSKFVCKIIKINPENEIVVEYSGPFKGRGTWFLTVGNNGVKVQYEIDLEITGFSAKIASYFLNLSKLHSKQMILLFENLDNYLTEKYNNDKSDNSSNGGFQSPTYSLTGN